MPTEEEFQETFSSFRLKNTKISIAEVEGLELLLGGNDGGTWMFPKPIAQEPEETPQYD
ncbi:hypothetical protein OF897_19720 [Chryseobacterium formosus]|uniref:Uncharacterized protein n=1 Tax=Chryseobacterium formosus TaxID=1537363 RepID=A0ABT3XX05_9FLAO|nr:hypothetical protein [Chryseobacterium formosus]MCX8526147.1 hypothetical protein [Chryseobacterium formosus]